MIEISSDDPSANAHGPKGQDQLCLGFGNKKPFGNRRKFVSSCLLFCILELASANALPIENAFRFDDLVVPPLAMGAPFQARITLAASPNQGQGGYVVRLGTEPEYRALSLIKPDFLAHAHLRPLDKKAPDNGYLLMGSTPWGNKQFDVLCILEGAQQKIVTNFKVTLSDSASSVIRVQLEPAESQSLVEVEPDAETVAKPQKGMGIAAKEPIGSGQYKVQIGDTLDFILGQMTTDGRDFEAVLNAFKAANADVWAPDGINLRVGAVVKLPFPLRTSNPTYASGNGASFNAVPRLRLSQVSQGAEQSWGRNIPPIPDRRGGLSPTIENPKGRDVVIRAIKEEIKSDRGGWPQNTVADNTVSAVSSPAIEVPAQRIAQADPVEYQYHEVPRQAIPVIPSASAPLVITREEIYLGLLVMSAMALGYSHLRRRVAVPSVMPPSSPEPQGYQSYRPPPAPESPRGQDSSSSQKVYEAGFEAGFKSGITAPTQASVNQSQNAPMQPQMQVGIPVAHAAPAVPQAGYYYHHQVPVGPQFVQQPFLVPQAQAWVNPAQPMAQGYAMMPAAQTGFNPTDQSGYVMTPYGPVHASQYAAINNTHMPMAQAAPVHPSSQPDVRNQAHTSPASGTTQPMQQTQSVAMSGLHTTPDSVPVVPVAPVSPAPQPVTQNLSGAAVPTQQGLNTKSVSGSQAIPQPVTAPTMAQSAEVAKESSRKRTARDERLDLARVYVNMGDRDTAKVLLKQIIDGGKPEDKDEAFKIFEKINSASFPKNMGVGEELT